MIAGANTHASVYSIDAENLTVDYNGKVVLHDATLKLPTGVICGLIGMNGSGKSTLFKALMGFITPGKGTVKIQGRSMREAQKRSLVAYVPQSEDVDWNFPISVWEVVLMGRYGLMNPLRILSATDKAEAERALKRVNLWDFRGRQIGELSGGQKKRTFVARALAQRAAIMLLDEPFAGVDAQTERAMMKLMLELRTEGTTMLISTHELTSVTEFCDHVALVKKTVLAYGPTEEVFTPKNLALTFDGLLHNLAIGVKPDAMKAERELAKEQQEAAAANIAP